MTLPVVGDLAPWADPQVVSIHRLPMRSDITSYADIASARLASREKSPWHVSLNGKWSIARYEDVADVHLDEYGDVADDLLTMMLLLQMNTLVVLRMRHTCGS